MFGDLVGSTALSTKLDPEDLREIMSLYQDAISGAVTRYGGHIAKYLGDGVLAYFGWPQAHEDQAERAVRASLDAARAVDAIRVGTEPLHARIGIESGQVVVGDLVGAVSRDAEAVSGETPNLAARLQGEARPGEVVIGPITRRLIGHAFELRGLGERTLKGFETPVPVWAVDGEAGGQSRFEARHGTVGSGLFGRQHELGLLLDRWQQRRSDGGQVVVLSGEAGIGKSRLVQAVQEQVAGEGGYRLRYQCSSYHTNSAFYPILQRLEYAARFAVDDDDKTRLDKLEALLRVSGVDVAGAAPHFAILLGIAADGRYSLPDLEPQELRERLFEALIGQVLALARQRSVLFVLEDAHWIDPTTEALVGQLMEAIADLPILMLITHRLEHVPQWPRHAHLTSVTLNRLSRAQAAMIVQGLAGAALPAEVADSIIARAEGVPLYLEELTQSVLEADDGSYAIPQGLQALLAARLDRLGAAKEIAQIGAVIGREFTHEMVAEVADHPESEIDDGLRCLVQSGLASRRGTPPGARYLFKHALIQDAACEGLLLSRLRGLHAKVVATIEAQAGATADENVELLAYHAERGELWNKALHYCRLAGSKANERSGYSEALSFLEMGLRAAQFLPDNDANLRTTIDIRLAMRPSLGAQGRFSRYLEVLSQAEITAQRLREDHTTAQVNIEKTHVLYQTGHGAEAIIVGRRALTMAKAVADERLLVAASANLASALFFHGELTEAHAIAAADADVLRDRFRYDQIGTTSTSSVNWLGNLTGMCTMLGRLAEAARCGEDALAIAAESGKPFDLAMAGLWNGFSCMWTGRVEAALQILEPTFVTVEERGLAFLHPWTATQLGMAVALSGDPTRADDLFIDAVATADRLGLVLSRIWARGLHARARNFAGAFDEAVEDARYAKAAAREHGFQWLEALAMHELGVGLAQREANGFAEAEGHFMAAIALCERIGARLMRADAERDLARAYTAAGRGSDAARHRDIAASLYSEMGLPMDP
jgi:class 3 adenylate cyclase/tetratricopeptide (TPR) repeat protein